MVRISGAGVAEHKVHLTFRMPGSGGGEESVRMYVDLPDGSIEVPGTYGHPCDSAETRRRPAFGERDDPPMCHGHIGQDVRRDSSLGSSPTPRGECPIRRDPWNRRVEEAADGVVSDIRSRGAACVSLPQDFHERLPEVVEAVRAACQGGLRAFDMTPWGGRASDAAEELAAEVMRRISETRSTGDALVAFVGPRGADPEVHGQAYEIAELALGRPREVPRCVARLSRGGYEIEESEAAAAGWSVRDVSRELTVTPKTSAPGGRAAAAVSHPMYSREGSLVRIPRHKARSMGLPEPCSGFERPETRPGMVFVGSMADDHRRQVEAFERTTKAVDARGGCILSLPTGYGKTAVAIAVACHYKVPTLVLVEKKLLLDQWAASFAKFAPGARVGRIQGGVADVEDVDVAIGMMQTVSTRYVGRGAGSAEASGVFGRFGLLIVDECHHIGAPVFSRCMEVASCPRCVGLSATPERADGLTHVLGWFLGDICFSVRPDFSAVRVRVLRHSSHWNASVPKNASGQVDHVRLVQTMCDDSARNEFVARTALELASEHPERHVAVFSHRVENCENLASRIRVASGGEVDVSVYVGKMSPDRLEAAKAKRPGVPAVVVGTYQMMNEGLDISTLNAMVMATPKRDVTQVIGRIVRTSDPVPERVVVDIVDDCMPMASQFRDRKATYARSSMSVDDPEPPGRSGARGADDATVARLAAFKRKSSGDASSSSASKRLGAVGETLRRGPKRSW